MIRGYLQRVVSSSGRFQNPAFRLQRSSFSVHVQKAATGTSPSAVQKVPSFSSQIRDEFLHGDGVFTSLCVAGLFSAALVFERWSSSSSKAEEVYVVNRAHEVGSEHCDHGSGDNEAENAEQSEESEIIPSTFLDSLVDPEVVPEVETKSDTSNVSDSEPLGELGVGLEEAQVKANSVELVPESSSEISEVGEVPEPVVDLNDSTVDVKSLNKASGQESESIVVESGEFYAEVQKGDVKESLPQDAPVEQAPSEEAAEEDLDECPFCVFMKGGGCKEEFIAWQNCVDSAREGGQELHELCLEQTYALKSCMEAHEEYYAPALQAGMDDEEDNVEEGKKSEEEEQQEKTESDGPVVKTVDSASVETVEVSPMEIQKSAEGDEKAVVEEEEPAPVLELTPVEVLESSEIKKYEPTNEEAQHGVEKLTDEAGKEAE